MVLSIEQLTLWKLPATPINYAVSYEYISKSNSPLISTINQHISANKKLDSFLIDELYKAHVLGQSKFRDGIVNELDEVLQTTQRSCQQSYSSSKRFITQLDNNISDIASDNKKTSHSALKQIHHASNVFKLNQQKLIAQLDKSQQLCQGLRYELKEVRKEIDLDPVTGLYNRKAMSKHVEQWHKNDPDKNIAVIVINIKNLSEFNQKFGSLLCDVILSKVANKISSYVNNSGLPVRTSGDEFLILLPEVEEGTANEIAEKISVGVEKLRFVSVQTGIRLPKMSVSLSVSARKKQESLDICINRVRENLVYLSQ